MITLLKYGMYVLLVSLHVAASAMAGFSSPTLTLHHRGDATQIKHERPDADPAIRSWRAIQIAKQSLLLSSATLCESSPRLAATPIDLLAPSQQPPFLAFVQLSPPADRAPPTD